MPTMAPTTRRSWRWTPSPHYAPPSAPTVYTNHSGTGTGTGYGLTNPDPSWIYYYFLLLLIIPLFFIFLVACNEFCVFYRKRRSRLLRMHPRMGETGVAEEREREHERERDGTSGRAVDMVHV